MPKKCHNCHQRKRQFSVIPTNKESFVRTEYGLAKIVEPSKVIIHNDDYMLRELQHSHYKMRSMEKEIKKLRHRLQKCQRTIHTNHQQHQQIIKSIEYIRKSRLETLSNDPQSSRTDTISSSQKREIGRFTRFSDKQTPNMPLSFPSQIGEQKTKIIPPSKYDPSISMAPPDLRKSRKSKESALEYSQQDEEVSKNVLRKQDHTSKRSSLLLSKQFEDEQSLAEKQKLTHQFDQLIIEQKHAPNPIQKRTLRRQIGVLSNKLATLDPDFT